MSAFPTAPNRLGSDSPTAAPADVLLELEAILESPPFRTSRQCQRLLRYVVEQSLGGHADALRERVIGMEVFERRADYDPGQDPVVRIRAADVRKRLALYYQAVDPALPSVLIDVPPGSYRATFRTHAAVSAEPPQPSILATATPVEESGERPAVPEAVVLHALPRHGLSYFALFAGLVAALVLMLAVFAALWLRPGHAIPPTAIERFWAPFLNAPQPVLLCLGTNAVYHFSDSYMAAYRREHHIADNGAELFPSLPPQAQLRASDMLPVPDTFVGFADVTSIVNVAALLAQHHKPFTVRASDDLSFAGLRTVPSILVGGFNNRWTLEMTGDLRFRFRNGHSIIDTSTGRIWSQVLDSRGTAVDDYALISRLPDAKTEAPLIAIAGIGTSGTQAAGEFVSSPAALALFAHNAPPGWAQRNVQVLLHVHIVEYAPAKTEVVAERFW